MRRALFRVFLALLVVASTLLLALVGTLIFGRVTGEEFAPDTWERRSYTYYELPLVRIQISSVTHQTSRPQLEQDLVDKQYISISNPPKRWDLVRSYRRGTLWRQGDAQILCRYLDAQDGDDNNPWFSWTDSHPELATILWPEVAKLAREELYFVTPDLFELAASVTDPGTFRGDLNRVLARRYQELADLQMELKNLETARRFQGESLRYASDSPSNSKNHPTKTTSP
ncbi:MAG: hypothetical protein ACYC3X_18275 [Pirellulaceae bacterium]